eukprot:2964789-Pleurochrysis_carterae.AAC.1
MSPSYQKRQSERADCHEGIPPPILRIHAAFQPSGQQVKRRSATLAAASIPGVRMAKLFGSA